MFYTLFAGFFVAVALMLLVGRLGIPLWVRVARLRPSVLMPLVVGISLIGALALRGNLADAWFALGFGIVGFLMLRRGYPLAPAVLGLVLGPMIETNWRRALTLSSGSPAVFFENPIALVLLVAAAASFAAPALRRRLAVGGASGILRRGREARGTR